MGTARLQRPLCVKAITVTLWTQKLNPLCALVGFPVARELSAAKGNTQELLCAVCSEAYREYTDSAKGKRAESQGKRVEPKLGWHKKEIHFAAGFEYILEECGSDRPAFCVVQEENGDRREICHFYTAMGLKRQHAHLVPCLARLYDFDFAL